MSSLLEGKVALVTGAGHGIGRAHALELASHAATVVVNDLGSSVAGEGSGRDADVVVGLIEGRGGKGKADYGDVGDEAQVEAMVAKAFDEFGHLDIVVNNAGIVRDRAIWNMTAADFDLVMRVHVRGSWLVSRAVAKRWRAIAKSDGGSVYGRIVNTTSGTRPPARQLSGRLMRIVVDRGRCTGQAMCESVAPDIFRVADDGQVKIQVAVVPDGRLDEAEWAVSCCPNQALEVEP